MGKHKPTQQKAVQEAKQEPVINHNGEQVKLSRLSVQEKDNIILQLLKEKSIITGSILALLQYSGISINPQQPQKAS